TDAFGHTQLGGVSPFLRPLIRHQLGYRHHYPVADYLMRAARHIASPTARAQVDAVRRDADAYAVTGKSGIMLPSVREAHAPSPWAIGTAPPADIANVEKQMPREYITEDGFHITAAARRYLQPLIAGEDYPTYVDGLPQYVPLQNIAVEKRTGTKFTP